MVRKKNNKLNYKFVEEAIKTIHIITNLRLESNKIVENTDSYVNYIKRSKKCRENQKNNKNNMV